MESGAGPQTKPETQVLYGQSNPAPQTQYLQPTVLQPQIVYILKYKPESRNLRHWSYLVFFFGILIWMVSNTAFVTDLLPMNLAIGESLCCFSFSIGFWMDAAFYKGKTDWEASTGQSNWGSTMGMITDILLGIISIIFSLVFLFVLGISLL
tara:strand:- start:8489 stop:8944 length:456 start_codon:yes stop_codon:yes gene_type:complete